MKAPLIALLFLLSCIGCEDSIYETDVLRLYDSRFIPDHYSGDYCAIEEGPQSTTDSVIRFYPDTLLQSGANLGTPIQGRIMGKKVNSDWQAIMAGCFRQLPRDSIPIVRLTGLTYGCAIHPRFSEYFTYFYVPLRVGCHRVNGWGSNSGIIASYTIWDNDLAIEEYLVDSSDYNYLEVTAVDTALKKIEGLFGLTFIKNPSSFSLPQFQDTVRFFNGRFTTSYQ